MDFTTTEAAQDLGGLVDTIVDAVCTPEHQRELDKLEQRFDRELWRKLIDAGILSSAAPESLGGDGFGVLEQVAVLVALGHQLAACRAGVGGRKHRRRPGGAAAVGGFERRACGAGISCHQHPGLDDRLPLAALSPIRLGCSTIG